MQRVTTKATLSIGTRKHWKHRPTYLITSNGYHSSKQLIVKGKVEKTFYGSGSLKIIKNAAQKIADSEPTYFTDLDRAMAKPDAAVGIGAVYITAEGKGGAWFVDENGETVEEVPPHFR